MDPFLLQKQLRENASDLNDFYKDLKSWGQEMKQKEDALKDPAKAEIKPKIHGSELKKKQTKPKLDTNKKSATKETIKSKIGTTDYTAWDKFDADAECEKVDYNENEESDLTDECDNTLQDQAFLEKEKGNNFVKQKKWDEAIKCYSKAIDCYAMDPIFYANRALCYLKTENYAKAEDDCKLSLKLDNAYVKAYQRRAAAREAMNNLEEAQEDLETVLELEPNNKETRKALENLVKKIDSVKSQEPFQRPVSKFTVSRNQRKIAISENKVFDTSKPVSVWSSGDDDIIPVRAVNKPPHLRSKKPLKRIEIQETSGVEEIKIEAIKDKIVEKFESVTPKPQSLITKSEEGPTLRTDDLKIVERQQQSNVLSKEVKNNTNSSMVSVQNVETAPPKNSVQFYSHWRHLKPLDVRYNYLKLIRAQDFPLIFKENLDSKVFSEIIEVFAECFIKNNDRVFDYLSYMTELRRFSTFTMFLTDDDKNHLWKLFDYVKQCEQKPKEDVDRLIKKYEL